MELKNTSPDLFALIGGDANLKRTRGNYIHSQVMHELHLNSSYFKIPVLKESISTFLSYAKRLKFRGLSVTMPLKEAILPFIDVIDSEAEAIGAVNTVLFRDNKLFGYNTDGGGAVLALEQKGSLQDKRVLILGAGGAAKAIAYVAKSRGASITILNRTPLKAEELSQKFQLNGGFGLEKMEEKHKEGYDILIDCTPEKMTIAPCYLLEGAIFMDIKTMPYPDSLLSHAKEKGCTLVHGYEMWVNQAISQYRIWFDGKIEEEALKEHLLNVWTFYTT